MRANRPSFTSSLVALMRAMADLGVTRVRDFEDPVAKHLLPPLSTTILAAISAFVGDDPKRKRAFWRATGGGVDLVALRAAAIDAAWHQAYLQGVRQFVIVGAGLDGRAWRLKNLRDVRFWELDHPATQAYKRNKAGAIPHVAKELTFVVADLGRDDLPATLASAGLDATQPVFWVWEGVIPYLPMALTATLLRTLAQVSAKGSVLAATYIPPAGEKKRALSMLSGLHQTFSSLGEPFIGLLTPDIMSLYATDAGWHICSDTQALDWAAVHADRAPHLRHDVLERLMVLQKT